MCFACDRDGKNPIHIAAIKGHMNVLIELVQVRPQAARILMDRSETILHACVLYNQLEAMKFLVEKINDHEFVNSKDDEGNTVLHLAVIDKQVEAVEFLTTRTTIEVNAVNANGFTALDILAPKKLDVKDWKIGELLRCAGAISLKSTPLLTTESSTTQTTRSILKSEDNNKGTRSQKNVGKMQADDWMEKKRNTLMVVASLIAAMAFQAGLNPPGGVWQDNSHEAGYAIMDSNNSFGYTLFFASNTTGFVASLSIILLLISGLPCFKHKFFMFILTVILWIAISAMTLAYLLAVTNLSKSVGQRWNLIAGIILGWTGLMAILILGHIIRVIVKMIKYFVKMIKHFVKLVKRGRKPSNSDAQQPHYSV